ncbi:MAG: carboxylating nicotinate-nucleotide diphosphorylase [Clostridia bacterium]|nr:carboxylating nicotinate-nucleotide diphosphorylase [Clostridia bacterium]
MKELLMSDDVERLIRTALREDIGTGDITTMSTVSPDAVISGHYIAKEDGIICGLDVVRRVFDALDADVRYEPICSDGDRVARGDEIAKVSGNAVAILSGERVGLNLLQHLSGIATYTRRLVDSVSDTKVRITETRKTTPGLRVLEKYAVRIGGGVSHRFGLSDGILIKDNHIVAAGGITAAVQSARLRAPHTLKIEVETETLDQVREAIAAGADIIMLDNMDCPTMVEAIGIIAGRAVTEASGNMGQRDLLEVAKTGVDVISVGALTHSVKALDISLKFTSLKN